MLKITDVRVSPTCVQQFKRPVADSVLILPSVRMAAVEIMTDEGITGIAPFGPYGFEGVKVLIETELKREILGEDPLDHERIWEKMFWQVADYGSKGVPCSALSVLDIALWDLRGKILKTPCYKLLGGFTNKVKAYRTGIDVLLTKDQLVKYHMDSVEKGFEAIKMKMGRRKDYEELDRVKAVRDAVGYKVRLMVDANQSWSVTQAIRIAKGLERYEIFWLEEPTLSDNIEGLVNIARSTEIPLALGENEYNKFGFKELMLRGVVGVILGDLTRIGGITEWKKIAAMAQAFGLQVSPQQFNYATVSALASIPNGLYIEFALNEWQVKGSIIEPTPVVERGEVRVLDEPGFGWRVNQGAIDKLRKIPWIPHRTTPPSLHRSEPTMMSRSN